MSVRGNEARRAATAQNCAKGETMRRSRTHENPKPHGGFPYGRQPVEGVAQCASACLNRSSVFSSRTDGTRLSV